MLSIVQLAPDRRLPVTLAESAPSLSPARLKGFQVAAVDTHPDLFGRPGLVLDYITLSSTTNYTFKCDTTYYVSGSVNLGGTNNVFEGGTVVKYASSAKITVLGEAHFRTGPYRPVVFTAKDDNSIGGVISGSSGSPSGYYASPALVFEDDTSTDIRHVRFLHAKTAVFYNNTAAGITHTLSHAQFVHCQDGIDNTAPYFNLRNALMFNVLTNFTGDSSYDFTGRVEHLTVNLSSRFAEPTNAATLFLTNSLLVSVTNLGPATVTQVNTYSGDYFQTVGAAAHYLLPGSYQNLGTSSIDPALLDDLATMTVFPPVVLSESVLTQDTTFFPQAERDLDIPDLGYHYPPLDYVLNGVTLSNASLTILPGTAVGIHGDAVGPDQIYGLNFASGAKLLAQGRPDRLNRIVRYNLVQEQANDTWKGYAVGYSIQSGYSSSHTIRFTEFVVPGGLNHHHARGENDTMVITFTDCQFHGGWLYTDKAQFRLKNCLLNRVLAGFLQESGSGVFTFYNNTFYRSPIELFRLSGAFIFKDNYFDQVNFTDDGDPVTHDYNGYQTGYERLTPNAANDEILASALAYETGASGASYQPTSSGLINQGSRTASAAGLYHHTVRTDHTKDSSTVDIGFHYIAMDGGVPKDTDGDGIPDYLEDTDGDGTVDSGETHWNSASDEGLTVVITQPTGL